MSASLCAACGATIVEEDRCPQCGAAPSRPPPATRDAQAHVRAPSTVTTPQQRKAIYLIVAVPMVLAAVGATMSYCAHAQAPTPSHSAPRHRAQ